MVRAVLFFVGTLALVGAGVLAFMPVSGGLGAGPVTIGTSLGVELDCGSVAAPLQAREGTGLLGRVVEEVWKAGTTCDELLEERLGMVVLAGVGGAVAIGLGIVLGILVGLGRMIAPRRS